MEQASEPDMADTLVLPDCEFKTIMINARGPQWIKQTST